ncbi:MAG TPA: phosphatidylglycerol lysyltransferase domain-containing protein [Microbacteriaceae bacterium]
MAETAAAGARTSRKARFGRFLLRRVRGEPFTLLVAVLLLVTALAAGSIFGRAPGSIGALATGYLPLALWGHWWSPITAVFLSRGIVDLIVVIVLAYLLIGMAERAMGTWRTVLAFAVTACVGTVLGVFAQVLTSSGDAFWQHGVRTLLTVDPTVAIAGTLMAASAFTTALVRRRIRVLTVVVALMLVLYSGQPADLYRAFAVAAGWGLGLLLRPPARVHGWVRSSHHEVRVLMASVIAVTAIGPAIALFTRSRLGLLAPVALLMNSGGSGTESPLDDCRALAVSSVCAHNLTLERITGAGPVILSILPLLTLLLVAFGLLLGRRFAVWLGIVMNGGEALLAAYYFGFLPRSGLPYVVPSLNVHYWGLTLSLTATVAIPAAIAVLLAVFRRNFTVLPSRRSVARYLVIVAGGAVALAAIYVGVGWSLRNIGFSRPLTIFDLLADVVERFLPVAFLHREIPNFLPATPAGWVVYHGVGPALWLVIFLASIGPLVGRAQGARGGDAARARRMLIEGGGDPLSFMTTWAGNSYWFDPAGTGAVAYRVRGGVAVTTGGPFGTSEPTAEIIGRFARFCDDNSWVPVFYSVDAELQPIFQSMGWGTLVVAEEAVVIPADWSTTGKSMQDIRTSINRASRAGLRAEWTRHAQLPLSVSTQLAEISEEWIAEKQLPEMGFTLGGIDELRDPDVALMLAIDEAGMVQGITSWLPSFRDGEVVGWTLDFMRRRSGGMNGVMEFLIAQAAERMREHGATFMSLSAAPLAHSVTPADGEGSATDRFLGTLSGALEPVYGFRSLLRFKRKFHPQLRPLLMAYPDPIALPRIGLALVRSYLPGLSVRQAARLMRS